MTEARAFLDGAAPAPLQLPASTSPNPPHRPSNYSPAIALTICERLAEGETLRQICRDDGMPGRSTVFRWLADIGEFAEIYAKALAFRADGRADEIIEIADDTSDDYRLTEGDNADDVPRLEPNPEAIARSKLRITARQWLMAKELPRKYGDDTKPELPPAAPNGEGATVIGNSGPASDPMVIENDPLRDSLQAWAREASVVVASKG